MDAMHAARDADECARRATIAESLGAVLRGGAVLAGKAIGLSAVVRGARMGPVRKSNDAAGVYCGAAFSATVSAGAAWFAVAFSDIAVNSASRYPTAAAGCVIIAGGCVWVARVAAEMPLEVLGRQTLGRIEAVRESVALSANPVVVGLRTAAEQ